MHRFAFSERETEKNDDTSQNDDDSRPKTIPRISILTVSNFMQITTTPMPHSHKNMFD